VEMRENVSSRKSNVHVRWGSSVKRERKDQIIIIRTAKEFLLWGTGKEEKKTEDFKGRPSPSIRRNFVEDLSRIWKKTSS